MAVLYKSLNVDEKYASAIEPNLYADPIFIPGVTFTDKYEEGPAGQIMVHKLQKGNAVVPGTPGRDFTDEDVADDLIAIQLNNNFQKSTKIYGVQENAVAFNVGEEKLQQSLEMVREGRQYSGLACLVNEGTVMEDTTATTSETAVANLIAMRKAVKDNHGTVDVALVNTSVYAFLLENLGLKENSDPAIVSAELIKRFGMNIIECNSFDEAEAKYYNYAGTLQTVDLTKVEMVVYWHEAFSIIDNFEMYRLKDSENFAGVKAQVEENVGFRVSTAEQVLVKKSA